MPQQTPAGQPGDNQANDFQGVSIPNRIGYRFMDLDPGANIYVQRDDKLVIQSISGLNPETVSANVRLLVPGRDKGKTQPDASTVDNKLGDSPFGTVVALNAMVSTGVATQVQTVSLALAEGYLLSVGLTCLNAVQRGQTFVRAYLVRGTSNLANVSYLLCGDYITINTPVGFPFSEARSPLDGAGWLRTFNLGAQVVGTDPQMGGAPFSRFVLRSFQGTLVTSAAVANRLPQLQIRDLIGTVNMGLFAADKIIVANTTTTVTAAPGLVNNGVSAVDVFIVLPTYTAITNNTGITQVLQMVTSQLQAGDQWTQVAVQWESYWDI